MSKETIPKKLEKRSDNCLQSLYDAAEAFSSGVSYESFNEITPLIGNKEMYDHLKNLIRVNIVNGINNGFEQMQIADKMEILDNLANEYPEESAWRPSVGVVDVSAQEKWGLTLRKLVLVKKLEALDTQNDNLKQDINKKRKILQQTKEKLEKHL
ncbi:hypothetical protein QE152_g32382 [Popillia japonica]|uniref:Uncharacterized protein n=1 Tax=Popillia japonica TaxID=7064 RepID=A0AAW1IZI3_POPJA